MRKRKQEQLTESPDMTPMLDIVFIMLIFFIVTTTFTKESAVEWSGMQKDETPIEETQKPLIVKIDETNGISVQGRAIDIDSLRANIEIERAKSNFKNALILTHEIATTKVLVSAVDQIKLAGISQVVVSKL